MVPSPIQGNAESSTISVQIFSFLEEQKQVAAKVSEVILIELCLGTILHTVVTVINPVQFNLELFHDDTYAKNFKLSLCIACVQTCSLDVPIHNCHNYTMLYIT